MQFKFRLLCLLITAIILLAFPVIYQLCKLFNKDGSHLSKDTTVPRRHNSNEPSLMRQNCDTIHIAFVAAGYNASKSLVTVLKSILFYRHYPLHFHFITDQSAQMILENLLDTWLLPSVNYNFYSAEALQEKVEWIPNAHYSSVYGLMKLLLPDILSLDHVIALDTDVTVVSDIQGLWSQLQDMLKSKKWLALVENQSDWYFGTLWKNHNPWPALGRGYNTGVMLLDLQAMRKASWSNLWVNITRETLKSQKYTSLADQDIINTLIKAMPSIVYNLSCSWNVQLSDHTHSDECYLNADQYQIIHWNSPLKTQVNSKHASYFRNLYHTFLQYDGNLLRQGLLRCEEMADNVDNDVPNSLCFEFTKEAQMVYRTHIYFFGEDYRPVDEYDISFVTQLSLDRMQNIETLLKHWEGPISLVLYATDSEVWQFSQYVNNFSLLRKRRNVAVHIVYRQGQFYPVNLLRNVAIGTSRTPYMFLCDIDFLPMFNLYFYLRDATKVLKLDTLKRALVVPAFESLQYRFEFPHDKSTLQKQSGIKIFRHSIWKQGHSATNYDKWYKASRPYIVQWAPDFEPYIVVHRNVSEYDQRFVGFGWNKVSHIMSLYAQGYEFIVLPDAFIIHTPHAPSIDIALYRTSKEYRKCLLNLKKTFIAELTKKYGQEAQKYQEAYLKS